MRPSEILKTLLASNVGKVGAAFLLLLVIISIYVVFTFPFDFGSKEWNNPAVWADNPESVPPSWTNLFSSTKKVTHSNYSASIPEEVLENGSERILNYQFALNYDFDEFPNFTSFSLSKVTFSERSPIITLRITRPDNSEILLHRLIVPGPLPNEEAPYLRYSDSDYRVFLSGDNDLVFNLVDFLRAEYNLEVSTADIKGKVDEVLFGVPNEDGSQWEILDGNYVVTASARFFSSTDSVEEVKFVLGGTVYGFMGTDSLGRDLATGLLFGFPVALVIGLVTAIFSTIIGTFWGIISGYFGGRTDTIIQRFCDVLANVPLLPILIFLTFILGQKLWLVIVILIAFGWPGLTIMVRSMVLHSSSSMLVESTRALGASTWRIMFRHVLFQIAPFVLAQMIFFTPGAILAEAGLSFLGLGDPSIPTWGQILESGFSTGAVYAGYWWWVLPPGLLVVFSAMTFVLLALGLEPVINPRLRK
jgi:peptide/nickel transport system permease protein